MSARRALDAVPDGWAKVAGEWVQLEPAKVTHWKVVGDQSGGTSYSANSRDDGRWAITKANEWLERMRGYGNDVHLEVWEQTWGSTPSTWSQVDS